MKTINSHRQQHGFFGLGFGLALLTLFGGTAAIIDKDQSEPTNYVEKNVDSSSTEIPAEVAVIQSNRD